MRAPPRSRTALASFALVALLGSCGDDPNGPGTLLATVETPSPLGGVVLEVHGEGIQGFSSRGDSRIYSAVVSETEGRHRVIVLSPTGDLRFGVQVANVRGGAPTFAALAGTTEANQPAPLQGLTVRVARP